MKQIPKRVTVPPSILTEPRGWAIDSSFFWICRIALLIFFISAVLCSCGPSSKNRSSHKATTDSTGSLYKDTFTTRKTETKTEERKDTAAKHETAETGKLKVTFKADTTKPTGPVVITERGDSTIIETGGRQIESVEKKRTKTVKDSMASSTAKTTQTASIDSSGGKVKAETTLHKKTEDKNLTVEKSGPNWWGFILGMGLPLILLAVAWKYRKKIPIINKIPWA